MERSAAIEQRERERERRERRGEREKERERERDTGKGQEGGSTARLSISGLVVVFGDASF